MDVWTCKNCRRLPVILSSLQEVVSKLESSVNTMRANEATLKGEILNLKAENRNFKLKVNHIENNNTEVKKLIETMSAIPDQDVYLNGQHMPKATKPHQSGRDRGATHGADVTVNIPTSNHYAALASVAKEVPATTTPSAGARAQPALREPPRCAISVTVISSSIVCGVAPLVHGGAFDATGHVYPGQTASQINVRIRHIPSSDVTVLATGTNNIGHQTLDQCKNEQAKTIDNVARKRERDIVIMGKIPKRYDKPELNTKIDYVNKFIAEEIAKRRKWFLMDVDLMTTDYKKDGLHFNKMGTAKYAHEIRHLIRSIKPHLRQGYLNGDSVNVGLDVALLSNCAVSSIRNVVHNSKRDPSVYQIVPIDCNRAPDLSGHFTKLLNDDIFWSLFMLVKLPRDGHCKMHSVVTVLKSRDHNIKDRCTLLDKLRLECINNHAMYLRSFDGGLDDFYHEMELYIRYRVYDTGFYDLIPDIMANVTKAPIIAIDNTESDYNVGM